MRKLPATLKKEMKQMHLRKSTVLKRIKNGETVLCVKLNLADPRVAEIAAMFLTTGKTGAPGRRSP